MRRCVVLVTVVAAAALVACSSSTEKASRRDTMTQRQKDSVLGRSGLPGAQGVTKAQRAADSVKARQAAIDTASNPNP